MSKINAKIAGLNLVPEGEYWDYSVNPFPYCSGKAELAEDGICPVYKRDKCFAFRIYERWGLERLAPKWHWDRLKGLEKLSEPKRIFVNLMGDFFCANREPRHVRASLRTFLQMADQRHKYIFATKQPSRLLHSLDVARETVAGENAWFGITVCNQVMFDRLINPIITAPERLAANFWISFEPLYEPIIITPTQLECLKIFGVKWATIGAETPGAGLPTEWVENLVDSLGDIPVWVTNNTRYPEKLQQFPEGLR